VFSDVLSGRPRVRHGSSTVSRISRIAIENMGEYRKDQIFTSQAALKLGYIKITFKDEEGGLLYPLFTLFIVYDASK